MKWLYKIECWWRGHAWVEHDILDKEWTECHRCGKQKP